MSACTGSVLLWDWNPSLLLATLAGTGLMIGVYYLQEQEERSLWRTWRSLLSGTRGKLAIAVGSGSFGALATYLTVNLWIHTENRWLAIASIAQGAGILLILLLLGGYFLRANERQEEKIIEGWLRDLTAADPLDRLIAVRSLGDLEVSPSRRARIGEFFRYLLTRENDPAVRSALLEHFPSRSPHSPLQPLSIPLSIPTGLAERV
jgi:hypothetical protein